MFESVKNALAGAEVDSGGLVLVSETATTSASPLVIHFLASSVANSQPVCFVCLHNTWGHYCNIGNKLGLNMRHHQEQGRIKVIEGSKLLAGVLTTTVENAHNHPFDFILKNHKYPLKNLYAYIKETVLPWKEESKQFQIILDNITFFLSLGVSSEEILTFTHYCLNLTSHHSDPESGCAVVVTTAEERDEAASLVTNSLAHSATAHLAIRSLRTGVAREVHGDLMLSAFNCKFPSRCVPTTLHFQYKLGEKNMKLFAPGTSPNIL